MASVIFKPQPSPTASKLYTVEFSRLGRGLGRKAQMSAQQMTSLYQGSPRDWPSGVDRRTPILKTDRLK